MRVVHLSIYDDGGGAARDCYLLHRGLRELGHDSSMLVSQSSREDPHVNELVRSLSFVPQVKRLARRWVLQRSAARYTQKRPEGAVYFTDDRSELSSDLMCQLPSCDVFNLHLVGTFVDLASFFRAVPRQSPVVWTLHDPNPFTGGCHYYDGCRRFNDGCGTCPALGSSSGADLSRAIWRRKKSAYSHIPEGQLHLVAPSRWLAGEAKKSNLLGRFPVSIIPYGLDTDVFRPRDKLLARQLLDIPVDSRVLLFAAASVRDRRKGFAKLQEALSAISSDSGIHLVSLGRGGSSLNMGLPHTNLGFIGNDRILSLAYSAADLYVIPTLDDNLPNTVIESLSCGTPVVGFNVGGVPDMVRDGLSGFVVPKDDTAALREAILRIMDNSTLRSQMSENCRRIAVEEYGLRTQAQRYLELYASLTSGSRG
jgi:glycosyltransferase involved in cell wall biosynthesis